MTKKQLLIIPGMPKSGTTYLWNALNESGAFLLGSGSEKALKELNFFRKYKFGSAKDFESLFEVNGKQKFFCDASPVYIFEVDDLKRILSFSPEFDLSFVICLRSRVEAIFSWYLHYIIHHEVIDNWARNEFKTPGHFRLLDKQSMDMFFRPILPGVKFLLENVDRERIFVFNHHTDYQTSSLFWNELSAGLGIRCTRDSTFSMFQFYAPHFLYFEEYTEFSIGGQVALFAPGDLVFVNNRKTRVWRNVQPSLGHRVLQMGNEFTTQLSSSDISYIQSIVGEDFSRSVEMLGLRDSDFPMEKEYVARRASTDLSTCKEIISYPLLLRSPDIQKVIDTGEIQADQIRTMADHFLDLTLERNAAVAEKDAAVAEKDAAVAEKQEIYHSTSWRLTKPLRSLATRIRPIKG